MEKTGFRQWTQCWHFDHVLAHGPVALPALMWLVFLALNIVQLFVYRQLGG